MSFLERVCACLDKHHVPYALVGGYAVALHGAARGTIDLDFIIRFKENDFVALEKALNSMGLESRIPVTAKQIYQFREEYIQNRNLIAWSFVNKNNPIEVVDVIITHNLSNCSTITKSLGAQKIILLAKKDLIKMKVESGREQDILDVQALESL